MTSFCFFFSSRRRHTRWPRDWSSDVCSSDLDAAAAILPDEENIPALAEPVPTSIPIKYSSFDIWLNFYLLFFFRALQFHLIIPGNSWFSTEGIPVLIISEYNFVHLVVCYDFPGRSVSR